MAENYQIVLDKTLRTLQTAGETPRLLLHSCCAPCSSYVLEYLSRYFFITVLYYNPNISPSSEYQYRMEEQQRLIRQMPLTHPVQFRAGDYVPERFAAIARGHESDPEGGERCHACYRLRLEETARIAAAEGYAYFTTALSISPLKNAAVLNRIGGELAAQYGVAYLYSDFKKREGYKRSCILSKEYGLYRQDYCGCIYSKAQAAARHAAETEKLGDDALVFLKKNAQFSQKE